MSCDDELTKKYEIYKSIRKQKRLFGTFGFRGVFGRDITTDKIKRIGNALALYVGQGKTIAIGKDPRISSDNIEDALIEGITCNGCNIISLGITTPNSLSLEINRQADAGVMITASHNPPEYNGLKCLNNVGRAFSPDEDLELEDIFFNPSKCSTKYSKKGKKFIDDCANDRYKDYITSYITSYIKKFKFSYSKKIPMKIVVDGCGGSASTITPKILNNLGYSVVEFNCKYDGSFKERNPEPTDASLEKLKSLVIDNNATMGIAHDGDGDRTVFVDEKGKFIQGDISACIIADYLLRYKNKKNRKEKNRKIAVTVAFSRIIEYITGSLDIDVLYTPVGEPYLAQAKLLCGTELGLEEHGSIMLDWSREGPMLSGLMAGILEKEELPLSELVSLYPKYFQIKESIILTHKIDMDVLFGKLIQEIPRGYEKITYMDGIRVDYSDKWFILRSSGTEPKIRIFSESKTEKDTVRLNNIVMSGIEKISRENF